MGNSDSRTIFRDQLQILLSSEVTENDYDYWQGLLSLPTSSEDIFTMLPHKDIRKLIEDRPNNLFSLITQALNCMRDTVQNPRELTKQAKEITKNAVRILTRIIPIMQEPNYQEYFIEYWWGEDTLGLELIKNTIALMFTPTYGVKAAFVRKSLKIDAGLLWSPGLLYKEPLPEADSQMWENRLELLKLIIAFLSEKMYTPISCIGSQLFIWSWVLTSRAITHSAQLFFSLINIILTFENSGYLKLPYTTYMRSPIRQKTVDNAIQVLIVLLDCIPPSKDLIASYDQTNIHNIKEISHTLVSSGDVLNEFVGFWRSVNNEEECAAIFNRLVEIAYNELLICSTYLPASVKQLNCYQEAITLLWKMMETNSVFVEFAIKSGRVTELTHILLYLLHKNVETTSHFGFLCILSFMLLRLSSEQQYSNTLNKPTPKLPFNLPVFGGCDGDLMIITLCNAILTGSRNLESLHPTFLIIISNISTYIQSISGEAAQFLLSVFDFITVKQRLFSSSTSHYLVFYALEAINNLIQYHWNHAAPLVYLIFKKRVSFEKLRDLTFPVQGEFDINPMVHLDTAPPEEEEEEEKEEGYTQEAILHHPPQDIHNSSLSEEEKENYTEEIIIPRIHQEFKESLNSEEEKLEMNPSEEEEISNPPGPIIGLTSGDSPEHQVKCSVLNTRIEATEEAENMQEIEDEIRNPIQEPWRPTVEWFEMWKSKMPIQVVLMVIEQLHSKLEHLIENNESNEVAAYDAIINTSIPGLLQSGQMFIIRQYQPQLSITYWLTSYIWGLIFLKNQEMSMFDLSEVKIFTVQTTSNPTR